MEHDFFLSLSRDIAKYLGQLTPGVWKAVEDENKNISLHEITSDLTLWLRNGGYGMKGRIRIAHERPRFKDGSYVTLYPKVGTGQISTPDITVSENKNGLAIAKDIVRRLLAGAEEVNQLAKERIKSQNEYESKKSSLTEKVVAICKAEARGTSVDLYGRLPNKYTRGYGEASVSSESIDIKLTSLPADMGLEILTAVRQILERRTA